MRKPVMRTLLLLKLCLALVQRLCLRTMWLCVYVNMHQGAQVPWLVDNVHPVTGSPRVNTLICASYDQLPLKLQTRSLNLRSMKRLPKPKEAIVSSLMKFELIKYVRSQDFCKLARIGRALALFGSNPRNGLIEVQPMPCSKCSKNRERVHFGSS